ncbi:hypothetical protein D3C73_1641610 [compost metagenome]
MPDNHRLPIESAADGSELQNTAAAAPASFSNPFAFRDSHETRTRNPAHKGRRLIPTPLLPHR